MGCASSASTPKADANDGGPDSNKALAGKQRRKLSVAPGHVGDISGLAADTGPGQDENSLLLTFSDTEVAAKAHLQHSILSRKGFIPYNKKKYNQDRYVLKYAVAEKTNVSMFGVMDGHGEFGHNVSQFVQDKLPVYLVCPLCPLCLLCRCT